MSLTPYPAPDARARELDELVRTCARIIPGVERVDYGRSVEDRPLTAVRVPSPDPRAPRVLVCANTHGPEFIGNRVAMAALRALAEADAPPALAALRDRAELWIAPCLNPDGYARTYALSSGSGPASLAQLRHNANGVDLNRNWPLPAGARRLPFPGAGSKTPGDATYRGPQPLSEPETATLDALLEQQDFHASANLHSVMGTLFPARVRDNAEFRTYRRLCRALRGAQLHTRYLRLASRVFDTFTGEQEDHQHHARRCWSVCVECFSLPASARQNRGRSDHGHPRGGAEALFWRFNPRDPSPWIANDLPGIAAFLLAALDEPRPGASS